MMNLCDAAGRLGKADFNMCIGKLQKVTVSGDDRHLHLLLHTPGHCSQNIVSLVALL